MESVNGTDLSADSAESGTVLAQSPMLPMASPGGTTVNLDQQIYTQRKYLFWVVLTMSGIMFLAFAYFFFCSHFFRVLIIAQPYAAVLAMAMLVIPSLLLWGLMRGVYRVSGKDENLTEAIRSASHISPLS